MKAEFTIPTFNNTYPKDDEDQLFVIKEKEYDEKLKQLEIDRQKFTEAAIKIGKERLQFQVLIHCWIPFNI